MVIHTANDKEALFHACDILVLTFDAIAEGQDEAIFEGFPPEKCFDIIDILKLQYGLDAEIFSDEAYVDAIKLSHLLEWANQRK